jgi:hypothetical protein
MDCGANTRSEITVTIPVADDGIARVGVAKDKPTGASGVMLFRYHHYRCARRLMPRLPFADDGGIRGVAEDEAGRGASAVDVVQVPPAVAPHTHGEVAVAVEVADEGGIRWSPKRKPGGGLHRYSQNHPAAREPADSQPIRNSTVITWFVGVAHIDSTITCAV